MPWFQREITLKARPRGVHLVTSEITDALPVPDFAKAQEGRTVPESVTTLGSGSIVGDAVKAVA